MVYKSLVNLYNRYLISGITTTTSYNGRKNSHYSSETKGTYKKLMLLKAREKLTASVWSEGGYRSGGERSQAFSRAYPTCRLASSCTLASISHTDRQWSGSGKRWPEACSRVWWWSTPTSRRSAAVSGDSQLATSPECWSPTLLDSSQAGMLLSLCQACVWSDLELHMT